MAWKVPNEIMIPIGKQAQVETGQCAASWDDHQIAYMRSQLPEQYQSISLFELRARWETLRKNRMLCRKDGSPSSDSRK